ncbi:MAG: hypothetical protein EOP06_32655 [Proteobacteria bacterium]|nr:MAG: hypothetical protein EOP06_32655 [Pseudomonadota bacterium]
MRIKRLVSRSALVTHVLLSYALRNRKANFIMKKLDLGALISFVCLLCSTSLFAQPNTGTFITASIGIGETTPYYENDTEIIGSGFFAQGEYVWSPLSWFGFRPYAGVVFASGDKEIEGNKFDIRTNAFLLGAKVRIAAPIPYVAPFIESGIGFSAGSFETHTELSNVSKDGVFFHVPLTLGLAVGKRHNFEVKFSYFFQVATEQVFGGVAGGFTFPLE